MSAAPAANPRVALQTTKGRIVIELYADKAPKTVKNFLDYTRAGFYNGTIFHRVIPGFMAQAGGFTPDMTEKPTRPPIPNEADNGLQNQRGTLAMARTSDPNSAGAQFFINVANNGSLNFRGKTPTAGATRCSATSSRGWTWWTRSCRSRRPPRASMGTCPCSRS